MLRLLTILSTCALVACTTPSTPSPGSLPELAGETEPPASTPASEAPTQTRVDAIDDVDAGTALEPAAASPGSGARIQMQARVHRGKDGSAYTEPARMFDMKRGAPCELKLHADGTTRCLPIPRSNVDMTVLPKRAVYAGPNCKTLLAQVPDDACEVPALAFRSESGACGDPMWRVYELGEAFAGELWQWSPQGECIGAGRSSGTTYYHATELTDFVEFSED